MSTQGFDPSKLSMSAQECSSRHKPKEDLPHLTMIPAGTTASCLILNEKGWQESTPLSTLGVHACCTLANISLEGIPASKHVCRI